ncbi:MAG: hypothetical protein ACP5KG_11465, partial [Myxococcota bacterium]
KELINLGIVSGANFDPVGDAHIKLTLSSDGEIYEVGSARVKEPLGFDIRIDEVIIPKMRYLSANEFVIQKDYEYKEESENVQEGYKYRFYITFIPFKIKLPERIKEDTNFIYPSGSAPSVQDDIIDTTNYYSDRVVKYEVEKTGDTTIDGLIKDDLIWVYTPYYPTYRSPYKIEWTEGYSTTTDAFCFVGDYNTSVYGVLESPYIYGRGIRQGLRIIGLPSNWVSPKRPKYYEDSIGRKVINLVLCGKLGSSGNNEIISATSPFVITTYFPIEGPGVEGLSWNHQEFMGNEPDDTPNFYYYWRNTKADCDPGNHRYQAGCSSGESTIAMGFYNPGDNIFYFCRGSHSYNEYTGSSGIDTFAEVCLHEKFHKDHYLLWWPNGYDESQDTDDDWVPDNYETEAGLDPGKRCSCNETLCSKLEELGGDKYATDYECLATINENNWKVCSADNEDYSDTSRYLGKKDYGCK